ncbi:MAG TPA: hypothetical protein PKA13_18865 [Geminicoccaceae bacterium]|nr:hypothetical protein [Geminicoccus sp.]HMU51844.1 hypothetical protein [Geminicoccaceae bacterium]
MEPLIGALSHITRTLASAGFVLLIELGSAQANEPLFCVEVARACDTAPSTAARCSSAPRAVIDAAGGADVLSGLDGICSAIDQNQSDLANLRFDWFDISPRAIAAVERIDDSLSPARRHFPGLADFIRIRKLDGETTRRIDAPGIATDVWVYPGLLRAIIDHMPAGIPVEIHLPPPLDGDCFRNGFAPRIEHGEIARPVTIVLPTRSERDRGSDNICSDSKEPPYLLFSNSTFKAPLRVRFPRDSSLGLALTANKLESSLEIVGADDEEAKLASPSHLPRVTINSSAIEGDTYIAGINASALDIYFNTTSSFTIAGVKVSEQILLRDNQMGPLRLRGIVLPPEFRVDANRVHDSLYVTEAQLVPSTGPSLPSVPSLLHNQIDGNLVVSLHAGAPSTGHRGFRVAGMAVGGSAYVSIADVRPECADGAGEGLPDCRYPDTAAQPAHIEIVDSRIESRLVVSLAHLEPLHRNSPALVLEPAPRYSYRSNQLSACRNDDDKKSGINFDLTGTVSGVFAWNLPDCTTDGLGFTWSGQKFDFHRFESRPLAGAALTPSDVPNQDGDLERRSEMEGLVAWVDRYRGLDRSEVSARLEAYTLAAGALFDSWSMKAEKIKANIDKLWPRDRAGEDGTWWPSEARMMGSANAAAAPDAGDSPGNRARDGVLDSYGRRFLYGILWVWGRPTSWGQYPHYAVALIVLVVSLSALCYYAHSLRSAHRLWPRSTDRAHGLNGGDRRIEQFSWERLKGQKHTHGWYSGTPGFLQRDERPWLPLKFLRYSIDCTIPLVQLGYRHEYQPISDGTWCGAAITWLPVVQLGLGIWFGSLAVALFFV